MMKRIDGMKKAFVVFYNNLKFRWKFIIIYTPLICIIIMVIGFGTYDLSMNRMLKNEKELMLSHISKIRMLIDFNLGIYVKESEILFYNTYLQEALTKQYDTGISDSVETLKGLYKLIDPVFQDMYITGESITLRDTLDSGKAQVRLYIDNSTIPMDMALTDSLDSIADAGWVRALYEKPGLMSWKGLEEYGNTQYFSFNRVLKNFKTNDRLGILSIRIPVSKLVYLVNGGYQVPSFSFYLVDQTGEYAPLTPYDQRIIGRDVIEEYKKGIGSENSWIGNYDFGTKHYLVAYETLQNSGYHLVGIADYDLVKSRLYPIRYAVILVLVAGAGASILFSILAAALLSRRIEKFRGKMLDLMDKPASPFEPIGGEDEIGIMDRSFNNLICQLRESHISEERHRHERAALQIELLQARINPHLLYNTMAAISWNARKSGMHEISSVSEELIRFYKHFLNHGVLISNVRDEISMIENYIKVMKFTYGLDFEVKILIADEVRPLSCPNLFLQPIVENAIVHGLRLRESEGGMLSVSGLIEAGKMTFVIEDNGIGLDSERAEGIFKDREATTGYGLANIYKRLSFYYGEDLEMKIRSKAGEGCRVLIRLPVLTFEQLDRLTRYEEISFR